MTFFIHFSLFLLGNNPPGNSALSLSISRFSFLCYYNPAIVFVDLLCFGDNLSFHFGKSITAVTFCHFSHVVMLSWL